MRKSGSPRWGFCLDKNNPSVCFPGSLRYGFFGKTFLKHETWDYRWERRSGNAIKAAGGPGLSFSSDLSGPIPGGHFPHVETLHCPRNRTLLPSLVVILQGYSLLPGNSQVQRALGFQTEGRWDHERHRPSPAWLDHASPSSKASLAALLLQMGASLFAWSF